MIRPTTPPNQPRACACGCGQTFTPTRPWHKYVDQNHSWAHWRKRNRENRAAAAEVVRIRKHIKKLCDDAGQARTAAEMSERLKKIDRYLNRRTMKNTTT